MSIIYSAAALLHGASNALGVLNTAETDASSAGDSQVGQCLGPDRAVRCPASSKLFAQQRRTVNAAVYLLSYDVFR